MRLGEPASKKTILTIRAFLVGLFLLFLVAFWGQIWGVLAVAWSFLKVFLLGFPDEGVDISAGYSISVICFNGIFGFGLVFLFWLILLSAQALLPVNNMQDVYRTAWRLWLYITHRHGPAIFIKDGVEISTQEDVKRTGHGVIVVDFNSAVVLEERDVAPGLTRMASITRLNLLYLLGLSDLPSSPRAHGAGIVFTRPNERIRGVVDLRPQLHLLPRVTCYTREGIELTANMISIFTVGDDPQSGALQVTYTNGRRRPEDWRVCTFVPSPDHGDEYLLLADLTDELDEPDRLEISQLARSEQARLAQFFQAYAPLPQPSKVPRFDPERVFAAVFAQAQNNEQENMPWTELPTRVAAGFYRELLPQIKYDELYDLDEQGKFPLPMYKNKLRQYMRNNGYLAYRLVYHCSGAPMMKGQEYQKSDLMVSEVHLFTTPKMLRDRGIRVNIGTFGDPSPVSSRIYQQRLDSWRAKWEQQIDIKQAERERDTMRIRGQALADAQQELVDNLSRIFNMEEYSEEALALRIIQSLETAAADPKTRQLLPGNTVDLMRYIHNIILGPRLSPQSPPNVNRG